MSAGHPAEPTTRLRAAGQQRYRLPACGFRSLSRPFATVCGSESRRPTRLASRLQGPPMRIQSGPSAKARCASALVGGRSVRKLDLLQMGRSGQRTEFAHPTGANAAEARPVSGSRPGGEAADAGPGRARRDGAFGSGSRFTRRSGCAAKTHWFAQRQVLRMRTRLPMRLRRSPFSRPAPVGLS
jgi:hypothetical protein